MCFDRKGKILAGTGSGGFVNLWEVGTWKVLRGLPLRIASSAFVALSPDGRLAAAQGEDNRLSIWDTATGKLLHNLAGHLDAVEGALFAPDGKTLTSLSTDGTTLVWDLAQLPPAVPAGADASLPPLPRGVLGELGTPSFQEEFRVGAAALSPDGKLLATASGWHTLMGRVSLWEVASGKRLRAFGCFAGINRLQFSNDGKLLVAATEDHVVCWDPATGERLQQFVSETTNHAGRNTILAVSPTQPVVAVVRSYVNETPISGIVLWNVLTGKEVQRFPAPGPQSGPWRFPPTESGCTPSAPLLMLTSKASPCLTFIRPGTWIRGNKNAPGREVRISGRIPPMARVRPAG